MNQSELQRNKQSAIGLYSLAFAGKPRQGAEQFLGLDYKQHNPLVGDGIEAFVEYFERMEREYPDKSITFLRAIAEDDLVALHTHQVWPGGDEYVTMDFFRFDDHGRIVEHWDSIQQIPEESVNGNTMY
ncbi:SnoaL-like domain-containing protein [Vibrio sp. SM6]|uniref:SnoaL-like domain-containing protein n=1 Tax=Vibrio agarilyticus TaxID=2726741 RepID=A0A7X8TPR8_9VIBR|nr:nuclear transport factor 2 family protein [Vibrio agarilyticus]NLS12618.1 SnoaL-like domain-containing protein [Vibrio agarilyticus]